ncbi:PREDICTED: phytochrome A-associated F-box protein isoform X2 [Nelumbo nucifera]|uniref:Phytochrome A-associated F-box protein isoform X2 n=1 Tax=Nelumbo nucifera TaxID=4432 RepID=A0A1U8ABS8_NELNU|nr:PREDICTED: phytochrome A-associated F-box protein isoform X2 [Nelumbo nucifera]
MRRFHERKPDQNSSTLSMTETAFFNLSDDIVLNILLRLEDDPRNWARLACVCTKFSALVRNVCWKNKCSQTIPSVVTDLLSASPVPCDLPGWWTALYKLSVCCPGLLHAGVLLENSDFGLERELGPDENYQENGSVSVPTLDPSLAPPLSCPDDASDGSGSAEVAESVVVKVGRDLSISKKRKKKCRPVGSHLAAGVWNLSREQGNKLLASRFRGDSLYICDWPGCVHTEEKRNYMLFRGVFKNFRRSRVWRTINDGNRNKIPLDCAFCSCRETWDLHSAFCLRRVFGYHDDGEPVVRAYVCENGHVSGAWTDRPMFT